MALTIPQIKRLLNEHMSPSFDRNTVEGLLDEIERLSKANVGEQDVPEGCLDVGRHVQKTTGYPFPGEVRAVFKTKAGLVRYVVEVTGADYAGMLHIFSPDQLSGGGLGK